MIRYDPLWKTMKQKATTTYALRVKHKISHSTVQSLQRGEHISTYTLDRLCKVLDCKPADILEYIPDEEPESTSGMAK
ncbi:helix-turn-helix domain-containing protein [Allofournierella sp.]|uniref:helix-turn-helix domain-containing protein n=1 Tax=Allofournierella sp. TaxID=1940256 RepID=UPI003AF013C5